MASLRDKASQFLAEMHIEPSISDFDYHFTGSYELDVMAWPDIDINLLYEPVKRDMIFSVASRCLELKPSWFELRCTEHEPDSPGNFFLGFEITHRNLLWNVDVWFLSDSKYDASRKWVQSMHRKLDMESRRAIVEFKQFLIERHAYPGKVSSPEVYAAVLENGILGPEGYANWFEEHHITCS